MKKKRNIKPANETTAIEDENRWRIESDLRTIQTAEAIRKDKARMREVIKLAEETVMAVKDMKGKDMKGKDRSSKPMNSAGEMRRERMTSKSKPSKPLKAKPMPGKSMRKK